MKLISTSRWQGLSRHDIPVPPGVGGRFGSLLSCRRAKHSRDRRLGYRRCYARDNPYLFGVVLPDKSSFWLRQKSELSCTSQIL